MGPLVLPVINMVWEAIKGYIPNPAEQEKAKLELLTKAQDQEVTLALKQIETNIEEAKNPSVFVSGWRPAVGWVCASALFYQFLGYPISNWAVEIWHPAFTPPVLDTGSLMELTLSMLGMAGLRSWEKYKDIARK